MEAISAQRSYEALKALSRQTALYASVLQLLEWDQETFMPLEANNFRSEQSKAMASLIHSHKTAKNFEKTLSQLIDLQGGHIKAEGLREEQIAALKCYRRDFLRDKALPSSFVEEFTETTSKAMHVWKYAREKSDFSLFAPYLEKIISLCQKKADYIGYQKHPYDALLDEFEPNLTVDAIEPIFNEVEQSVRNLLKKIPAADDSFLSEEFDKDKQLLFSRSLLEAMGYDFNKGRLDLSTHPFSMSLHPTDSRVTTRIQKDQLMGCLSAALHEGGHSLYEMGLPLEQWGTPLGASVSLGMHESQSRWWECFIGQSLPFWRHFFPLLQNTFSQLKKIDLTAFYRAINKVAPSLVRVEADEVTYPLHVILRFKLEKQLIEGSLKVANLPEAWNAQMENLLGLSPPNASLGCLQDVHWSMGAFGYFPTYALGNIYAAELFAAFTNENQTWENKVEKGELSFIKEWLSSHVYRYGRQYNSKELVEKTTKKPFSAQPYIDYLTNKYLMDRDLNGSKD